MHNEIVKYLQSNEMCLQFKALNKKDGTGEKD